MGRSGVVELDVRVHSRIDDISAQGWNALVADNNPLVRHEFLAAMEHHGCVGELFGWLPRHLGVYDQGQLVGAMPLYEKTNSYGEFVFDHAWADAYARHGFHYFPKLVSAVPYTPATGQRLLAQPGMEPQVYAALLDSALSLLGSEDYSSFHCLFPTLSEWEFLQGRELLTRFDCQFHWHNRMYASFDDFLAQLSSRKRKNIRNERRRVVDSGVTLRVLDGHMATETDWADFSRFYRLTFETKWGYATFNQGFFAEVGARLPDSVVLVLADLDGVCIAGALMYRSDTTLYGRHWGCSEQVDNLHFEACYYQGIEYCIRHGLARFEPGAQGEHKIARGFVPVRTQSAHWIANYSFRTPIRSFVEHEREGVMTYIHEREQTLPYRKEES